MDFKLLTEEDYQHLLKRFDKIDTTIEQKIDPQKKIYSNEELCKLLGISKRTSQTWRDRKWIEYSQVGNKIYYTWEQIQSFLAQHKVVV